MVSPRPLCVEGRYPAPWRGHWEEGVIMLAADTLLTGFSAVVIIALIIGFIVWRTRKSN
jgi:hypothetical protein